MGNLVSAGHSEERALGDADQRSSRGSVDEQRGHNRYRISESGLRAFGMTLTTVMLLPLHHNW